MAQRNTVNVIEYINNKLASVHAFTNDYIGNKEAEDMFRHCAKDNEFSAKDIKNGIKEGYLDHSDGEYQLYLVHSE